MIEQKYYDEFADKQSFETFIKDFNDRLNNLELKIKKINIDLDRLIHTTLINIERLDRNIERLNK